MKSFTIPSSGATLIFDSWQEQLAHDLAQMLHNMNTEGMQIVTAEEDDFDTATAELDAFNIAMSTWLGALPVAGDQEGGDPRSLLVEKVNEERTARGLPAVPDANFPAMIASVVSLALAGTGAALPAIVLNVVANVGLSLLEKWLEGRIFSGATPETSEITNLLDEIFIYTEGSTRKSAVVEALLENDSEGNKAPILWGLIGKLINIYISRNGDLDDISFE